MEPSKFCPICQCLILSSGFCRNKDCKFSNKYTATANQITKINDLCEELNVPITNYNYKKITTGQASRILKKLLLKKAVDKAKEMRL